MVKRSTMNTITCTLTLVWIISFVIVMHTALHVQMPYILRTRESYNMTGVHRDVDHQDNEVKDVYVNETKMREIVAYLDPKNRKPGCPPSERRRRFPDAVLIGERKTGTAKITHFLTSVNHRIHSPPGGETHFFTRKVQFRSVGFEYYRTIMSPTCPGEVTIEKTPSYFRTRGVAQKMSRYMQHVKILLSLRDPIRRAISDFYFEIRANEESAPEYASHTFEELAFKPNGEVNPQFGPLERSHYDINFARWLRYFPSEQIHVIDADAFSRQNPATELVLIEEFLGLTPKAVPEMFYKAPNGYFCLVGTEFLEGEKGHSHPPISRQAVQALRQYFAPHVDLLYKLVGRKLLWMDSYLQYLKIPI